MGSLFRGRLSALSVPFLFSLFSGCLSTFVFLVVGFYCPTLPLRVPIRVFQMGVIAPRVFVVASLYNRICYRK